MGTSMINMCMSSTTIGAWMVEMFGKFLNSEMYAMFETNEVLYGYIIYYMMDTSTLYVNLFLLLKIETFLGACSSPLIFSLKISCHRVAFRNLRTIYLLETSLLYSLMFAYPLAKVGTRQKVC